MESKNNDMDETRPTASQPGVGGLEDTRPVQPEATSTPGAETVPTTLSTPALEETRPVFLIPAEPTELELTEPPFGKKRRISWVLWAILGVFLLALMGALSGYAGYLSAIERRTAFEATQVFGYTQMQFDLGVQDLEAGRYDLARQRFEEVIRNNPNFPGVTEKLADVLMRINATATPTVVPTPTLTPTPDLRSQEVIFTEALTQLAAGDWTGTIDTLLTLRKRFPAYRAVEVDGMLFVALRNRGVQKISQLADLEGGIYDLALAERFGPIDVEAKNWRDWAELYVRGASFWDVDWQQAVFYFSQLSQIAPNLMDGSRYTASERYRLALISYGDWFVLQELWCEAQQQYDTAYNMSPRPELQPTANHAAEQCANPTSEPQVVIPTFTPTVTPTPPSGEQPTATVTPTQAAIEIPTETPTESPTATPTETFTPGP